MPAPFVVIMLAYALAGLLLLPFLIGAAFVGQRVSLSLAAAAAGWGAVVIALLATLVNLLGRL